MEKKITILKGDGIGPEIVNEAIKVLDAIANKYNHKFVYNYALVGGAAIDEYNDPFPQVTLDACLNSDSILLGAVGGPKWDTIDPAIRPEKGLLKMRKALNLYSNLRPAKIYRQLAESSPLKQSIIDNGIDIMMVRELTGGVYFGEHTTSECNGVLTACDTMSYDVNEIKRVGIIAFETARKRRNKLHSIDKANVLDTSKLWRKVMHELSQEYPDVEYADMLVDNAAMQLVKNPGQFDVVVTENMFGDILSDESSMITGSIGLMPSSSLGESTRGLYEPIHGSAPDIANMNIANPIGTILSAAMMLRYSFDMDKEAIEIEQAVDKVLDDNYRTVDIMKDGMKQLSCSDMGDIIVSYIKGE